MSRKAYSSVSYFGESYLAATILFTLMSTLICGLLKFISLRGVIYSSVRYLGFSTLGINHTTIEKH